MAVTSAANINCAYPAQQNIASNNTCPIQNSQSFKGNEEKAENNENKENNGQTKNVLKSKKNWLIGGLIAVAGAVAIIVAKKNNTPIKKLIKNMYIQDTFGKEDFVDYVKENHADLDDFKKSFVMRLDKRFKTEHNIKDSKNLLLLGYYAKGGKAPIITQLVNCKKIGSDLRAFFDTIDMSIFKGTKVQ